MNVSALNEHIAKLQELKTELKRLNEESDERLKQHRFVEQDLFSVGEDISREKQCKALFVVLLCRVVSLGHVRDR